MYYFSGLMHWWEVQIARKFCSAAVAARYLHLFLSCNEPIRRSKNEKLSQPILRLLRSALPLAVDAFLGTEVAKCC